MLKGQLYAEAVFCQPCDKEGTGNNIIDFTVVIPQSAVERQTVHLALSLIHISVTDGKGGVFWHTQGSGKSLSMVFYAHYLQEALESPTIVVITDRTTWMTSSTASLPAARISYAKRRNTLKAEPT